MILKNFWLVPPLLATFLIAACANDSSRPDLTSSPEAKGFSGKVSSSENGSQMLNTSEFEKNLLQLAVDAVGRPYCQPAVQQFAERFGQPIPEQSNADVCRPNRSELESDSSYVSYGEAWDFKMQYSCEWALGSVRFFLGAYADGSTVDQLAFAHPELGIIDTPPIANRKRLLEHIPADKLRLIEEPSKYEKIGETSEYVYELDIFDAAGTKSGTLELTYKQLRFNKDLRKKFKAAFGWKPKSEEWSLFEVGVKRDQEFSNAYDTNPQRCVQGDTLVAASPVINETDFYGLDRYEEAVGYINSLSDAQREKLGISIPADYTVTHALMLASMSVFTGKGSMSPLTPDGKYWSYKFAATESEDTGKGEYQVKPAYAGGVGMSQEGVFRGQQIFGLGFGPGSIETEFDHNGQYIADGERETLSGNFVFGLLHGPVVSTTPSGAKYNVEYAYGKRVNNVREITMPGFVAKGPVNTKTNKLEGPVDEHYPDGRIVHAVYNDGKAVSFTGFTYANGNKYTGLMDRQQRPHGEGTMKFASGNYPLNDVVKIIGDWNHGQPYAGKEYKVFTRRGSWKWITSPVDENLVPHTQGRQRASAQFKWTDKEYLNRKCILNVSYQVTHGQVTTGSITYKNGSDRIKDPCLRYNYQGQLNQDLLPNGQGTMEMETFDGRNTYVGQFANGDHKTGNWESPLDYASFEAEHGIGADSSSSGTKDLVSGAIQSFKNQYSWPGSKIDSNFTVNGASNSVKIKVENRGHGVAVLVVDKSRTARKLYVKDIAGRLATRSNPTLNSNGNVVLEFSNDDIPVGGRQYLEIKADSASAKLLVMIMN